MKYIIDIPDNDINKWINETPYGMTLSVPLSIENGEHRRIKTNVSVENYSELYQKDIGEEVWGLADYVYRMSPTERNLCFGFSYPSEIYMNLTFQEAKAKLEKWIENESENEIHVGDEVKYEDSVGSSKFIVLREDERYYYGIHSGGDSVLSIGEEDYCWKKDNVKKTGRYFENAANLIKMLQDSCKNEE